MTYQGSFDFSELINIATEATESAAISAFTQAGLGDKNAADAAAVNAMRKSINKMPISAEIKIGEGEMDEAPMLYIGEKLGTGGEEFDIAVDPLEGTSICAKLTNGAMSVIAMGPKGSISKAPDIYMDKLFLSQRIPNTSIDSEPAENVLAISSFLKKPVEKVTVSILDRERHINKIESLRKIGARINLIGDGDISAAIRVLMGETDMHIGSGGSPEGSLAAAVVHCLGGFMQCRFLPETEEQLSKIKMCIKNFSSILSENDLVRKPTLFCASAITDAIGMKGVIKNDNFTEVSSLIMLSNGEIIKRVRKIPSF